MLLFNQRINVQTCVVKQIKTVELAHNTMKLALQ
ncbi:hypothetical protein T4A_1153 [Trichinella pseudospiralis]|uniref:Uncharacterized protein n=1 Tax=Trichinella pseudospiralis TaxID=6337 RepID=A0A0V1DL52_TRIPS|nr:hypothetical protein T4A_1153 [Trichinella pseudospiralis]